MHGKQNYLIKKYDREKRVEWLLQNIDIYCERTSTQLLAEPLNLFSNLWFVLVGVVLVFRKTDTKTLNILSYMFIAIGIGSSLFHSFANKITELSDVIPIGICATFFGWSLIQNLSLTRIGKISTGLGFIALELIVTQLEFPILNGSEMYLGPLLFIWFFAVVLRTRHRICSKYLFLSAISFTVSITFRAMDLRICDSFPYGTHFLWHSFNALTLMFGYFALENLMIKNKKA